MSGNGWDVTALENFGDDRTFFYSLGGFLRIVNRLFNRTQFHWLSNLHLVPDLVPKLAKSGFTIAADDFAVEVRLEETR